MATGGHIKKNKEFKNLTNISFEGKESISEVIFVIRCLFDKIMNK